MAGNVNIMTSEINAIQFGERVSVKLEWWMLKDTETNLLSFML